MSQSFDNFPVYDPLIKKGTNKISDVWSDFMATFVLTLTGYLTQYGIFIPRITTVQRDSIQHPQEGQMIYNTDAIPGPPITAQIQVWQLKAGVAGWHVFTTTP